MGTEILRSHDCLQGRFRHDAFAMAASPIKSRRNSNPNPNPNSHASSQSRRRKRSPVAVAANSHDRDRVRSSDRSLVAKSPTANLVMGQVKILKRGEKLSPESLAVSTENRNPRAKIEETLDLVLGSTDRLGPDPETVQKQVRVSDLKDGIYAGSAFVASPPPSSVPVPAFLVKNGAATSDLRRLLRLDLMVAHMFSTSFLYLFKRTAVGWKQMKKWYESEEQRNGVKADKDLIFGP